MKSAGRSGAGPSATEHDGTNLAALLAASARGDHAAFAELYRLTAGRMFGVAVGVVRDRARAEEVTQEAFLYIWTNSARHDPGRGQALPWMLAVVHARAVDAVRSSQASAGRDRAWGWRYCDPKIDATAELVQATTAARRVREAMRSLTDKQRSALELTYFGGCTHREVADRLGIPVGTAKTRIRTGLRRLAALLEDPKA